MERSNQAKVVSREILFNFYNLQRYFNQTNNLRFSAMMEGFHEEFKITVATYMVEKTQVVPFASIFSHT